MKHIILLMFMLLCGVTSSSLFAQNSPEMDSAFANYENQKYFRAKFFAEEELSNNPKNSGAHRLLIEICLRNKEYEKAVESCNKAIKTFAKDKENLALFHSLRAQSYENLQNESQCEKNIKTSIKLNPRSEYYLNLANFYIRQNNYDLALKEAQKALEIKQEDNNLNLIANSVLADIFFVQNDFQTAKKYIDIVLEYNGEENINSYRAKSNAYKTLATINFTEENYLESFKNLVDSYYYDKNNTEKLNMVINFLKYFATPDISEEMTDYIVDLYENKGFEVGSWILDTYYYQIEKDFEKAIYWKKEVLKYSYTTENCEDLIGYYQRIEQYNKAQEVLNSLPKENYKHTTMYLQVNNFYYQKLYNDAMDYADKINKAFPNAPFGLIIQANIAYLTQDYELAKSKIDQASKFFESSTSLRLKGYISEKLNKQEEAKKYYQQALEKEDDDVRKALTYSLLKDNEKSLEILNSIEDEKIYSNDLIMVAKLYYHLGKKIIAYDYVEEAINHKTLKEVALDEIMYNEELFNDPDYLEMLKHYEENLPKEEE